jgi:integrase
MSLIASSQMRRRPARGGPRGKLLGSHLKRFIFFHDKRHPASMGGEEVNAFLSWLATDRNVSASTQNQALGALLFLYRHVLGHPLPWLKDVVRATHPSRLPVVMTPAEVRSVLNRMTGPAHLVVLLLYGAGLRLLEGLMLRVKNVDFVRGRSTSATPRVTATGTPCSRSRPCRSCTINSSLLRPSTQTTCARVRSRLDP